MTDIYSPANADLEVEAALADQVSTYRGRKPRPSSGRVIILNEDGTPSVDDTIPVAAPAKQRTPWLWTAGTKTLTLAIILLLTTSQTRYSPLTTLVLSLAVLGLTIKVIRDRHVNKAGRVITWFFLIMGATSVLSALAILL